MSYPKLTQMMEFVTPGAPLVHNTHAPPMVGTGARNGVYDLSDEELYTLRHCARCQRYYTIRDTDGCYFHPGKFVPPQTKRAVEIGWTCCAKLQPFGSPAFDANSKGCQFSVDHMEDLSFTKAIQAFPFHHKEFQKHRLNYLEQRMQDQRMNVTPLPPEKDDAPKKSKAKSEDLSSNPNYLAHPVSPADTLFGIALKYGMEVSDVKRINKLVGNDVIGRKVLYIPKSADALAVKVAPELNDQSRKRNLMRKFKDITNCESTEEAKFYMEEANFDIKAAIELYNEDADWAATSSGGY